MATVQEMRAEPTAIDGLLCLQPKAVTDERGTVREYFRVSSLQTVAGRQYHWAQVNLTWTRRGGVRGLHGEAMTKLIGLASGTAFGVWLDARAGSPSYGAVVTRELEVGVQMLVPPGVCNGFQATSEGGCEYLYCFDSEWAPGMAGVAVTPLDSGLDIAWPIPLDATDPAMVSAKDAGAPSFDTLR